MKKPLYLEDLLALAAQKAKAKLQAAAEEKAAQFIDEIGHKTLKKLIQAGDKKWGK